MVSYCSLKNTYTLDYVCDILLHYYPKVKCQQTGLVVNVLIYHYKRGHAGQSHYCYCQVIFLILDGNNHTTILYTFINRISAWFDYVFIVLTHTYVWYEIQSVESFISLSLVLNSLLHIRFKACAYKLKVQRNIYFDPSISCWRWNATSIIHLLTKGWVV